MMVKAVRIHQTGGPEVLTYEDISIGAPGPGEAHIRNDAIGLNFLDVYYRTGLYPSPSPLPLIPGHEGAGVVLAVGPDVKDVKIGDRVAYTNPIGAYAEERLIPADRLVKVPGAIALEQAASMMLKGLDCAISAATDISREKGRYDPLPCGSWRRWIDCRSMGETSRRDSDRHSRLGGEGQAGAGSRI